MEILILYFIGALLGLIVVLHYVLKSMERALDKLFPSSYDQKRGNGEGATSTPTGYEYRGEG